MRCAETTGEKLGRKDSRYQRSKNVQSNDGVSVTDLQLKRDTHTSDSSDGDVGSVDQGDGVSNSKDDKQTVVDFATAETMSVSR